MLRGTRVFARCDATGALAETGGRVEVRYRAGDGKAYRAAARNLELLEEPILPDEYCSDAAAVAAESPAASRGPANLVAYTDGACSGNPGPAGLGVVLLENGARRELSEFLGVATNNIAELTAILRALEAIGRAAEPVHVHTDSQYAIGVLTKNWKPKANQELIATLKERIRNFPQLKLVYVRGHAGIPLNERADALARSAVTARASSGWVEIKAREPAVRS